MNHHPHWRLWTLSLIACAALVHAPSVRGDEVWQAMAGGMDFGVRALAVYNGELISGGHFSTAGGTSANYIARWNGSSWQPMGSGMNVQVIALTVFNGELIAGGSFSTAGGVPVNNIARWNGSSWQTLGAGVGGTVMALTVYNGELIVGGQFTTAGGVSANRIAGWNGSTWRTFGSGMINTVNALTVYNGDLIAGGDFQNAGGVSGTNYVARWNGIVWQSMMNGTNDAVAALTVYNNQLIVGGGFNQAGNVFNTIGIASWNGSDWQSLANGVWGGVYALTVYGGELIVGGEFASTVSGVPANNIARWNGVNWQPPLGSAMDNMVVALTTWNGALVAGGFFTNAGDQTVNYIALSTANSTTAACELWQKFGSGMNAAVQALTHYQGQLIAGGTFTTAGGAQANSIARWNGTTWQSLGGGMTSPCCLFPAVGALTVYNNELIAGGQFKFAGGVTVNGLARWNGTSWQSLGSGMQEFSRVHALTVYDGALIVGGFFTTAGGVPANYIARWDGSTWQSLGSGMNDGVFVLTVHNGELIAGGRFSTAGGSQVNRIARWNGLTWEAIGGGMDDEVHALTTYNTELVAGGVFGLAGGVSARRIARWNGATWQSLGSGMSDGVNGIGSVGALTEYNGELVAGGYFPLAGDVQANAIARWNGSIWRSLGSGMSGSFSTSVGALTDYNNELVAGGNFGFPGSGIARWHPNQWSAPIDGLFTNNSNWDYGHAPGAPTSFGLVSGSNPFTVAFDSAAQSDALCITNQRPVFDLNANQYSITNYTTIGGTQTAHLTVNNGTLFSPVIGIGSFGTLGGDGMIIGNIFNAGLIQPGSSSSNPGPLAITGNVEQPSFGTLDIGIGAISHGYLNITGNAEIAGTLRVQMVNVNQPPEGSFPIITATGTITGAFDVALLPFIGDDLVMNLEYPGVPAAMTGGGTDALGGGGINITVGVPSGSPDPDDAQNVGLTGEPTGITELFIDDSPLTIGLIESDLALSIADLDPQNNGNVLVLLNQGGGASFTPIIIEVGHEPSGIASAALADGTAIDDLAVPNLGDDTISVLFHESSPPGNYTVVTISSGIGNAPSAIAAADLDGDSLADLAITNREDNTVSILINNGNRTFTPQTPIGVGGAPLSIAAGDFQGSALNDLVVANSTGNSITILENQGGGGGTYALATAPVGPTPIIVKPTDVDNDRDLDIICSLATGHSVAMIRNLGGGVMANAVSLPMDGAPGSMDAWDMDKDGDEDVVVVVDDDALQEPVIRLLRNDSTLGQIAYTVFDPIGAGEMPHMVNGSDVSGDSLDDLVSVNVTPLAMAMSGGKSSGASAAGPRDPSMSIRRMLLGTEPECRADVAPVGNLDNTVGVPDLLFIINNWGPCVNPNNCPADLAPPTGDDTVGVPDLLYIINNWGPCQG